MSDKSGKIRECIFSKIPAAAKFLKDITKMQGHIEELSTQNKGLVVEHGTCDSRVQQLRAQMLNLRAERDSCVSRIDQLNSSFTKGIQPSLRLPCMADGQNNNQASLNTIPFWTIIILSLYLIVSIFKIRSDYNLRKQLVIDKQTAHEAIEALNLPSFLLEPEGRLQAIQNAIANRDKDGRNRQAEKLYRNSLLKLQQKAAQIVADKQTAHEAVEALNLGSITDVQARLKAINAAIANQEQGDRNPLAEKFYREELAKLKSETSSPCRLKAEQLLTLQKQTIEQSAKTLKEQREALVLLTPARNRLQPIPSSSDTGEAIKEASSPSVSPTFIQRRLPFK